MRETTKASIRRTSDFRYSGRWIVGYGIDIGAGDDSIIKHHYLYPRMIDCLSWDLQNGDAQKLNGQPDNYYDFVHSSHCLEHLNDPHEAFQNWIRVCKPGGHLIITIPDRTLYEHDIWPSNKTDDHKHNFTMNSVFDFLNKYSDKVKPLKVELVDYLYDYKQHGKFDQTLYGISECAIELILKKL